MADDHLLYEPVPEVEPEVFADNDDDGLDDITQVVNTLIQRDPTALREARPSLSGTVVARQAADDVAAAAHVARTGEAAPEVRLERHPTVVDDFIRNFLIRAGMRRSLEAFNTEWYEMKAQGLLPAAAGGDEMAVPDVYAQNEELQEVAQRQRVELAHVHEVAAKAQATWDRFRKERDFHRMHHQRVAQEKNRLIADLKRLRGHYAAYEPALVELKAKYDAAMKERAVTRLERDRLAARVAQLEAAGVGGGGAAGGGGDFDGTAAGPGDTRTGTAPRGSAPPTAAAPAPRGLRGNSKGPAGDRTAALAAPRGAALAAAGTKAGTSTGKAGAAGSGGLAGPGASDARFPAEDAPNPYLSLVFEPARAAAYKLAGAPHPAHSHAVSALVFHPTKPVVVTASDDATWRMWALPDAELIMTGEGHRAWLADVDFHPAGTHIATSAGDGVVKLWSLASASCAATLTDHTQTAWGVAFHSAGDFLASCSMDHTAKLWDAGTGRVRQTFRGHVDSVNAVAWQPFAVHLATASGDKTVSLWDARTGLCVQTFYGHTNAVNDVTFSLRGDTVASCDADGVVRLWDIRMVAEAGSVSLGRTPVHSLAFDRSALVLAAACEDGGVRIIDCSAAAAAPPKPGAGSAGSVLLSVAAQLSGHKDAAQAVAFDPTSQYLVSSGNDATLRVWSE